MPESINVDIHVIETPFWTDSLPVCASMDAKLSQHFPDTHRRLTDQPNRVDYIRAHTIIATLSSEPFIMNPLVSPSDSPAVGDMVGACVQLAPSAHVGAIVGAIVEFIVGAIVGALVGAGVVAITLTTANIPRSATLETNISTPRIGCHATTGNFTNPLARTKKETPVNNPSVHVLSAMACPFLFAFHACFQA